MNIYMVKLDDGKIIEVKGNSYADAVKHIPNWKAIKKKDRDF